MLFLDPAMPGRAVGRELADAPEDAADALAALADHADFGPLLAQLERLVTDAAPEEVANLRALGAAIVHATGAAPPAPDAPPGAVVIPWPAQWRKAR